MSAVKVNTPKIKKVLETPEAKSVKFSKSKTPITSKRKFPKTPHSSKTPHVVPSEEESDAPVTPIKEKKKRKLFVEADVSPQSPKKPKFTREQIADMIKPAKEKTKVAKQNLAPAEIEREKTTNTVFVGNLPVDMSRTDIKKLFSKYGNVATVRLRCAALNKGARNKKGGIILKQFEPGTSICAFIKYATGVGPKAALRLNGKVVKGHHIRVNVVDPTSKTEIFEKNKSVFLRNLPFDLTDDELWSAFTKCGDISSVRVMKDKVTYRGRGLGYVNFAKSDSVELALKMNGSNIKDRPVIVQRWGTRIDEKEGKGKKKDKKKAKKISADDDDDVDDGGEQEFESPIKQKKGALASSNNFTGNKATGKKMKKTKKLGIDGIKKKKLAKILAK